LDAAQAVDALLELETAEEVVDVEEARLGAQAVDRDGPGPGHEGGSALGRPVLVGRELVEVVVGGDLLVTVRLRAGRGRGRRDLGLRERLARPALARRREQATVERAGRDHRRREQTAAEERAPRRVRHFVLADRRAPLDEHPISSTIVSPGWF